MSEPGTWQSPTPTSAAALQQRLQELRELVLSMGEEVDRAMARATAGLVSRDVDLCTAVIGDDERLDRLLIEARQQSLEALAGASAPADVRAVLGLLHMAIELERMADHCANIARIGRTLADLPPIGTYVDIPRLAEVCADQMRQMLGALVADDVQRARAVAARDDRINRIHHRIVDELVELMSESGDLVFRGMQLVMVSQNFERIGDRVTNLAEDLVFLETGVTEHLG